MTSTARRRPTVGAWVRFALMMCLGLGLTAMLATSAMWTTTGQLQATTSVQGFHLEYSFDGAAWRSFDGPSVTVSDWPGIIDTDAEPGGVTLYVRNASSEATAITITPALTGVLAEPGFVTVSAALGSGPAQTWSGAPLLLQPTASDTVRVSIDFDPGALSPSSVDRLGSLAVTVSGAIAPTHP